MVRSAVSLGRELDILLGRGRVQDKLKKSAGERLIMRSFFCDEVILLWERRKEKGVIESGRCKGVV